MSERDFLKTPFEIRGKKIENRLILSPMATLTTIALREVIDEFKSPGILYTEMCNARAVIHENRFKSPVFRWRDEEASRLMCQIFESDPDVLADAASRIEKEGLLGVDINMGCSVAPIYKRRAGAWLLKDPSLAVEIVRKVRDRVKCLVFVKYRVGWEDRIDLAVELGKRFEEIGVDGVIFHPRVAPDRRARPPKWRYIKILKENLKIFVFGNGNVFSKEDAFRMIKETGCDGVAIGRLAAARPWIFKEILDDFSYGDEIYLEVALKMVEKLWLYFEPTRAIKLFKKWAHFFCANFFYGHKIYSHILKAGSKEELLDILPKLLKPPVKLNKVPDLNLFMR